MQSAWLSEHRPIQLVLALAFSGYYGVVVLNNCLDYQSNFTFVQHVMAMDTTFADNALRGRAVFHASVQQAVYNAVIVWEGLILTCLIIGTCRLLTHLRAAPALFDDAKKWLLLALTLGLLLWFGGFVTVAGEWFLMWQSRSWNADSKAFEQLTVHLLAIIILMQRGDRPA